MADVLFYHLEHKSWTDVLPRQLATSVERGWRCVVQVKDPQRLEEISELLWNADADVFLAHGTPADGRAGEQPIWLTAENENPNMATVKFFVEGAEADDLAGLARAVVLFDGRDAAAVARARDDWKRLKSEGHDISYYQQDENLRWVKRASTG